MAGVVKNGKTGGKVTESVIRRMTRLAMEYDAVNLSQGFPNEGPPMNIRLALAHAVLTGNSATAATMSGGIGDVDMHHSSLSKVLSSLLNGDDHHHASGDVLNQYSPPMGREDLRQSISDYYKRLYDYDVSADDITVTLGATEALACCMRSLGRPGDKAVIFEPFHEVYPNQCSLFYLEPTFVTLRPSSQTQEWGFDKQELKEAMKDAKMLLLNTPHNPTGKIFTKDELRYIVDLCLKYNVYLVTDEIYEHMTYAEDKDHICIPQAFPEIAEKCLVCNSLGKSASATGWRVGWCLTPPDLSQTYRGIHDQLAVMSPHPMQYATLSYLALPDDYFRKELKFRYQSRIEKLASTLVNLKFDVVKPEGAYYLLVKYNDVDALSKFTDPMDAAMYLLKEVGVASVPGNNFYGKDLDEGNQYIRFAACRSEDDINEACKRLEKYLS